MVLEDLEKYFHKEEEILKLDETLVCSFTQNMRVLLMLDYERPNYEKEDLMEAYAKISRKFNKILDELKVDGKEEKKEAFLNSIPEMRRNLNTTIEAILQGDPAAISKQQIVLDYPGFEAILYHRVAHQLHILGLPLLARYISEYAHHRTGIDINPGATIGDYFFIDHGTGIVVGETAIIADHVKLYQGVTLGAKSLAKGRELVGKKRHPTIEDHVTIYANAAILGDTTIGHDSTIGGDVYLTHSVPPHSVVIQSDKDLKIIDKD